MSPFMNYDEVLMDFNGSEKFDFHMNETVSSVSNNLIYSALLLKSYPNCYEFKFIFMDKGLSFDLSAFYIHSSTVLFDDKILKEGVLDKIYNWSDIKNSITYEANDQDLFVLIVMFMEDEKFDSINLYGSIANYKRCGDECVTDKLYKLIKNKAKETDPYYNGSDDRDSDSD